MDYNEYNKNDNNKNKFRKGILVGSLVTAFIGLSVVGVASGIRMIAGTVTDNQVRAQIEAEQKPEGILNFERIEAKMSFIQDIIETHYLFEEDPDMVEAGIYSGLMAGLQDPYSVYYREEDFEKMKESTAGIYCGIGASVSQNSTTGLSTVVKVFKGSPAEEAGMLPGDIIYKVGDIEATGVELDVLVNQHIRGAENTEVMITVFRTEANDYEELEITRRILEVETVEHQMLDDKIGYILISQFDEVTTDQFKKAIDELEEDGMEALIVDLRNNPGGILNGVVDMMAYVLPEDRMEGMLVYTEDKNGNGDKFFCKNGKIYCERYDGTKDSSYPKPDKHQVDVPMAVLINEHSASASEIFAGAMKDYEWATLVGTTSYGKGIVQNLISLGDGTAIKLTTSHYFTPSGFSLHEKGVEPDVKVELDEELKRKVTIEPEEDNQLQKAIEVLLKE